MSDIATPIETLIARLQYQAADVDGRLLRGTTIHPAPLADVKGATDFPYVMVMIPDYSEQNHARALINPVLTLRLVVSVAATPAETGLTRLLRQTAAVLNSLERTIDGNDRVDPNLNDTTKPFSASTGDNFALDLSLNAQLTITIEPRPFQRGRR